MGEFLLIAGAVVTAGGQRQAAGAKEVELELQQRDEDAGARDREVQRERRIAAILGAQAADAAAKGLQLMGSVANISIVDAQRAGEESLIDDVNTRARINVLSRRARSISRAADTQAAGTLFRAGASSFGRG